MIFTSAPLGSPLKGLCKRSPITTYGRLKNFSTFQPKVWDKNLFCQQKRHQKEQKTFELSICKSNSCERNKIKPLFCSCWQKSIALETHIFLRKVYHCKCIEINWNRKDDNFHWSTGPVWCIELKIQPLNILLKCGMPKNCNFFTPLELSFLVIATSFIDPQKCYTPFLIGRLCPKKTCCTWYPEMVPSFF